MKSFFAIWLVAHLLLGLHFSQAARKKNTFARKKTPKTARKKNPRNKAPRNKTPKVTVCHCCGGGRNRKCRTIKVPQNALQSFLNRGATEGECGSDDSTRSDPPSSDSSVVLIGDSEITLTAMVQSDQIAVDVGGFGQSILTPEGITFDLLDTDLDVEPSIVVPFSESVVVTPFLALYLTEFLLRQVAATLEVAAGDGRRLDSPGCDLFPDASCNLSCCAVHDRCYAQFGCDATSWSRNLCLPLALAGVALGNPITTALGVLFCAASIFFDTTGACAQCNTAVVNCIALGCSGVDSPNSETCYDNECNVFFECEGDCPFLSFNDTACCGCRVPGVNCSSPSTCGNGACDFAERRSNCFVDCAYNACPDPNHISCNSVCIDPSNDSDNCGSCGIACPPLNGVVNACVLGRCSVPISITWTTTQFGVLGAGGWAISNDGRTVRFAIEDSVNCGGPNANTQFGMANADIVVSQDYQLTAEIIGVSELQDANFELMNVFLDGTLVVSATANDLDLGCQMGPSAVTFVVPMPFLLSAGAHTFQIEFTTNDPLYHVDAFYELNLVFAPV